MKDHSTLVISVIIKLNGPCDHCDYKATTKFSLKKHKHIIQNKASNQSLKCDYKAATKTKLKEAMHESAKHPKDVNQGKPSVSSTSLVESSPDVALSNLIDSIKMTLSGL